MPLLKQIPTGTRFGRLVTVSQVYSRTSPVAGKAQGYVTCRCDCGSPVVEIIAYELRKVKNPVRACRDCATIVQIPEGAADADDDGNARWIGAREMRGHLSSFPDRAGCRKSALPVSCSDGRRQP
jgi:hypothetical protein